MKIGVNIKLDVTKLNKERFFQGKKGKYVDLTAFIDTEQTGEYGDNGTVSQSTSKEERQNGTRLPICGNVKVFYKDEQESHTPPVSQPGPGPEDDDMDVPF